MNEIDEMMLKHTFRYTMFLYTTSRIEIEKNVHASFSCTMNSIGLNMGEDHDVFWDCLE